MAQFLAQLSSPISGGLSLHRDKDVTTHWTFNILETIFFEPDDEYTNMIVGDHKVKKSLSESKLTGVYIITGLKIARGASYSHMVKKSLRTRTGLTADAAAITGITISAGPELGIHSPQNVKQSYTSCSDFVWAIRLRKIRVSFWNRSMRSKEMYGGQLSAYGDDVLQDTERSEMQYDRPNETTEVDDMELDDQDLGLRFTPNGFKRDFVIDEFGHDCAVIW